MQNLTSPVLGGQKNIKKYLYFKVLLFFFKTYCDLCFGPSKGFPHSYLKPARGGGGQQTATWKPQKMEEGRADLYGSTDISLTHSAGKMGAHTGKTLG